MLSLAITTLFPRKVLQCKVGLQPSRECFSVIKTMYLSCYIVIKTESTFNKNKSNFHYNTKTFVKICKSGLLAIACHLPSRLLLSIEFLYYITILPRFWHKIVCVASFQAYINVYCLSLF